METVYSQKFKDTVNSTPMLAARHNSRYVMPEHLLLALLSDSGSEAAQLIDRASRDSSSARLQESLDKELFNAAATGNGPVDAAINAVKQIIRRKMTLKEFTIQAINRGSDDVGKVHMQVEHDGALYFGFGANTDIIAASVEAYIDCINKFRK